MFTSIGDFNVRLLFPAHAAEGLPFILEILFLSMLRVVPTFLFLSPLLKERQQSKHPFLLFCRASWHPPSCLGCWRWRKKTLPGFIFLSSLSFSSCAQTSRNRRKRRDVRVAAMFVFLHLFSIFLWLCLPPFTPPPLSVSAPLCFCLLSAARCLCSVVTGDTALRVRRHNVNVLIMLGD